MDNPKVTILMSFKDGGRFFDEALKSIQHQTMENWELLLVDDGSTDGSLQRARDFVAAEPRACLIENETNIGLAASLNRVVEMARAPFLARMDADDISRPHRLEKQLQHFATDPELGLLGSNIERINRHGRYIPWWPRVSNMPLTHPEIRAQMLFRNPMYHPTIMVRRAALDQSGLKFKYDETFDTTQDYELWARLIQKVKFANMAEPLVQYRKHAGGITTKSTDRQYSNGLRVQRFYCQYLLGDLAWDGLEMQMLRAFSRGRRENDRLGHDYHELCQTILRFERQCAERGDPETAQAITDFIMRRVVYYCLFKLYQPRVIKLLLTLIRARFPDVARSFLQRA
ncbi:MAG: hypothetical protein CME02_09590 [Geminicoccus sp.]|nr:hypothetical protein [Geminicoccus sp.]